MNKSTWSHDRWTTQSDRGSPNGDFLGCATDAYPTELGRFLPYPWAHQGDQIWLFQWHRWIKRESRSPYCGSFQGLRLRSWWTFFIQLEMSDGAGQYFIDPSIIRINNKGGILQQTLVFFHHAPDKWRKY